MENKNLEEKNVLKVNEYYARKRNRVSLFSLTYGILNLILVALFIIDALKPNSPSAANEIVDIVLGVLLIGTLVVLCLSYKKEKTELMALNLHESGKYKNISFIYFVVLNSIDIILSIFMFIFLMN